MSGTGLAGATLARMSKPPPNVARLLTPLTNDLVVVAPTTSVNTTSVNIASVTPVRKRLRSGIGHRHLQHRRERAGSARAPARAPPSRTSALYMIVQLAPTTIMSPERMKIEKSMLRLPNSQRLDRQHEPGDERQPGDRARDAVAAPRAARATGTSADDQRARRRSRA